MVIVYLVSQVLHVDAVDNLGAVLLDAGVDWSGLKSGKLLQLLLENVERIIRFHNLQDYLRLYILFRI